MKTTAKDVTLLPKHESIMDHESLLIQEFNKGRLQGLQDMDEAHQRCADFQERIRLMGENDQRRGTGLELEMYVQKLRSEYSGK